MGIKSAIILLMLFCATSPGFAATGVNAACELMPNKPLDGVNANSGFVVASLSKIFTTYWALEKIGPHFQYETVVHIETLSPNISNVHISGGADPTWGREMLHYLASELDRLGVRKIETLTFDENFLLSWRAQAKEIDKIKYYYDFTDLAGAETALPTAADIQKSLQRHFKPRVSEYQVSLQKAALSQVVMTDKLSISAPKKVQFLSKAQFKATSTEQVLRLRSLPVYKILKMMNVTSNNFLADMFFLQLGGIKAFQDFVLTTDLSTHASAMDIRNGSGYPIKNGETKFYNSTSCSSIVHSMELIDKSLHKTSMGLEFVFPVATSDVSTLDKYELPPGLMVAKTGTVNPTITFAGMIKTAEGPLYFSQLIKTDSAKDWPEARALIKKYLLELVQTQAVALSYSAPTSVFWGEGNRTIDSKP